MAVIETGTCPYCGNSAILEVDDADVPALKRWLTSPALRVQDVLPHWSPGRREMLLSSTHSECFDKMFPEEEA